ncbi:MarR family transcriptional regulator [Streptomyces sp. NPDC020403]|uniref:MarR family transcriptional regulator n=1 Tax=unclassified Streptomyces TaxID=2593676 RepID=UPI003408A1DF
MDIKSLAKDLPLYGQMAIGSALRALAVTGHLRRVRRRTEGDGPCRWVTLTYWSRTAHDNEWWTARLAEGTATPEQVPVSSAQPVVPQQRTPQADIMVLPSPNLPQQSPAPKGAPGPDASHPAEAPSPAYLALAELGRREPRLALSAADCATLEPLAAAWFARGVSADYLTSALTAGLPEPVASPIGLVRRRLTDKMPPRLTSAPAPGLPSTHARGLLVECTACGRPGPAEALPDGLCKPCRTAHQAPEGPGTAAAPERGERDVAALVGSLRNLMRSP